LRKAFVRISLVFITLGFVCAACSPAPPTDDSVTEPQAALPQLPAGTDPASLDRRTLLLRAWSVQMAQVEATMTFKSDGTVEQQVMLSPGVPQTLSGHWELKNNDTQLVISYDAGQGLTWDILELSPEQLRLVAPPQPGTMIEQKMTLIPLQ
jgi:hypothetical protein